MSSLVLTAVSKSYGDVDILHDVHLAIEAKEFVVVVGPSGCGKSTLLRMVAGLELPNSGQIHIDDSDVTYHEPKNRNIAMVFQNYALYPHMSVFDNMAYGLRIRKVSKRDIAIRVNDAAKLLQLSPYLMRKPSELSGGQRQRVAMGRAIVRNPAVFLFDEPLSNLDSKLRMEMRLEIKKLQQRLGITCLYVTHDQTEAMTMADRIVILNQGRVEQIDTPMGIYLRPKTKFVAGFMGNVPMNFFEKTIHDNNISWGAQIKHCLTSEPDKEVVLGVRPEDMFLKEGGLEVTIDLIEHLGSHCMVYGKSKEGESLICRLEGDKNIAVGDTVAVDFNITQGHFFDKTSGERI